MSAMLLDIIWCMGLTLSSHLGVDAMVSGAARALRTSPTSMELGHISRVRVGYPDVLNDVCHRADTVRTGR